MFGASFFTLSTTSFGEVPTRISDLIRNGFVNDLLVYFFVLILHFVPPIFFVFNPITHYTFQVVGEHHPVFHFYMLTKSHFKYFEPGSVTCILLP